MCYYTSVLIMVMQMNLSYTVIQTMISVFYGQAEVCQFYVDACVCMCLGYMSLCVCVNVGAWASVCRDQKMVSGSCPLLTILYLLVRARD